MCNNTRFSVDVVVLLPRLLPVGKTGKSVLSNESSSCSDSSSLSESVCSISPALMNTLNEEGDVIISGNLDKKDACSDLCQNKITSQDLFDTSLSSNSNDSSLTNDDNEENSNNSIELIDAINNDDNDEVLDKEDNNNMDEDVNANWTNT